MYVQIPSNWFGMFEQTRNLEKGNKRPGWQGFSGWQIIIQVLSRPTLNIVSCICQVWLYVEPVFVLYFCCLLVLPTWDAEAKTAPQSPKCTKESLPHQLMNTLCLLHPLTYYGGTVGNPFQTPKHRSRMNYPNGLHWPYKTFRVQPIFNIITKYINIYY